MEGYPHRPFQGTCPWSAEWGTLLHKITTSTVLHSLEIRTASIHQKWRTALYSIFESQNIGIHYRILKFEVNLKFSANSRSRIQ